jgi:transposase
MAMGTRKRRERQEALWVSYTDMAVGPGHPFYVRLNEVLDGSGFDVFVEKQCARFYADKLGRPGLTPGIYLRSLMIGYFEGIEAERGIAWRLKDSLSLRRFLGVALDEDTPDHSTISRTRRLIDVERYFSMTSFRCSISCVLEVSSLCCSNDSECLAITSAFNASGSSPSRSGKEAGTMAKVCHEAG